MSKIKLSPNLFLEVNELNKLINFLENDGYKLVIKHIIKQFGIAKNVDNTMFNVTKKIGTDNVVVVNSGIAIDSDVNVIRLEDKQEISIPYSNNKQWLIISYSTTNNEIGYVDVSNNGNLTGNGTKFLSVLRGQPNFPTKVKFLSNKNIDEYEVVDVQSDTLATLSGSFIAEKSLRYQVIGTFTPGFQPNDEYKMIYEYDSVHINLIESSVEPTVDKNSFIIACIEFNDSIMSVEDKRMNFINESISTDREKINTNSFVSLNKIKLFEKNILNLNFEWCYKILNLKKINNNIIQIVNGYSNFTNNFTVNDNVFNGWKLLNRSNMSYVYVDYNESNNLYLSSSIPSDFIREDENDFILIPDCKDIEIELKISGEKYEENVNYYSKFSIENKSGIINIPLEYLENLIELRYRMIYEDNKTTKFQKFSVSQFENINKEKETLGDSSFSIFINEPEEVKRNYS